MSGDAESHAPKLVVQLLAVGDVARERLLVPDGDARDRLLERARVDALRAVAEQAADLPREEPRQLAVGKRRQLADRSTPRGGEPLLGAGPTPGSSRTGNGARNAASRPAGRP